MYGFVLVICNLFNLFILRIIPYCSSLFEEWRGGWRKIKLRKTECNGKRGNRNRNITGGTR